MFLFLLNNVTYMSIIREDDPEYELTELDHIHETTEELRYILKDATTGKCPDCESKKVDMLGCQELYEIFCQCTNKKCQFSWVVLADEDPCDSDDARRNECST